MKQKLHTTPTINETETTTHYTLYNNWVDHMASDHMASDHMASDHMASDHMASDDWYLLYIKCVVSLTQ